MAVYLPIISEFNGKGIAKAKREFKSLEGAGAKAGYILKKAFLPTTAAIAGLAAVAMKSVDAALEDQKSQIELARVMRTTMNATDGQIKSTEDWISAQGKLLGITDDELRPALGKLFRVTRNTGKSFKVAGLAMDIARGTGKDMASVTDALTKALGGNMKSLKALAPELGGLIKDGATVDEVFAKLGETFKGSASKYAETTAGRMEILKLRFSELFEQLGYAFLPAFEKLMPYFEDFATWLEKNPDKVAWLAEKIGQLASVIAGIPDALGRAWKGLQRGIEQFLNWTIDKINFLADKIDWLLGPLINIGAIENVKFTDTEYKNTNPFREMLKNRLPTGVTAIPVPAGQGVGAGSLTAQGQILNMTINVGGGDPRAVIDAITRWSRQNGNLPPQIRTAR